MRAYTGYVKIWRQVFLSDFALSGESCSRREAWIELICLAEYEGPNRGSLTVSERYLAQRWKWSRGAVQNFLKSLEKDGRIERKSRHHIGPHKGVHITICNYEKYQASTTTTKTTEVTKVKEGRSNNKTLPKKVESRRLSADMTVSEAFEAYNALAQKLKLPVADKLTQPRRQAIAARLAERGREGWERALAAIERSSFLRGEGGRENVKGRVWCASLDFVCRASSFQKLIEGAYGNGANQSAENSVDRYLRILNGTDDTGHPH